MEKLTAQLGVGLNDNVVAACLGVPNCLKYGSDLRVRVISNIEDGFQILWTTHDIERTLTDCYHLDSATTHWFGGPERWNQEWPIEKVEIDDFSYNVKEDGWTAVIEPYWLNSRGAYIFVNERVPLFVDQNNDKEDYVCFIAKIQEPYKNRTRVLLDYTIVAQDNAREAHLHAVYNFLGRPTGKDISFNTLCSS